MCIRDRLILQGQGPINLTQAMAFGDSGRNGAHHIRFDGIRITNWGGVAVNIANTDIEFRNCRIDNNGKALTPENQAGYGFYIGGSNVIVEKCELDYNGGYGIHQYSSGQTPSNNTYRYNIIHDNGQTISANSADGILLGSGSSSLAYGNVIYKNSRGAGISINYGCTGCKAWNNTVYANGAGIIVGASASSSNIRNNIIYGNASAITNNGIGTSLSNNLTTDPKFVSEANYEFRLQSTSPAINAGISILEVTTDIDGTPRPQGTAYDIGAYEYR